jgi:vacuolar-type H+-ATPase subunit I/STV1
MEELLIEQLEGLNMQVKTLNKQVQTLNNQIQTQIKEIKANQSTVKQQKSEIQTLEKTITLLQEKEKNINQEIKEREKNVTERENQQKELDTKAKKIISQGDEEVVLNIGGTKFFTSKTTLTVQKNAFEALFSSEMYKPNKNGEYFFDRDPEYFGMILKYLRGGKVDWGKIANHEEFVDELEFYCIVINELHYDFYLKVREVQKKKAEYMKKLISEHEKRIEKERSELEKRIEQERSELEARLEFEKARLEFEKLSNSEKIKKNLIQKKSSSISAEFSSKWVIKRTSGNNDKCGILFSKAKKWKIKIMSEVTNGLMIGVASESFNPEKSQYLSCGRYIHTSTSTKYPGSITPTGGSGKCDSNGDEIIMEYSNGNLKYIINGNDFNLGYSNLSQDLFPAITRIFDDKAHFELEFLE